MTEPLRVPTDRDASGRSFGDEELALLEEVIRSGSLNSNSGRMVRRFEEDFARYVGSRFCIACNSGSLAVQAALAALELSPGARVVTSPITDFGAITAIVYERFVPVFCDVDVETLMPTPETVSAALDEGADAVVATHLFGRPARIAQIRELCEQRGVVLIEDAAQTLGSTHRGRRPGTFGALGAFSFQQSKHISCGEGGAVVTDDEKLARRARLFVNKAWPYGEPNPDHLFVAPNGRLTELQAAVLVAQLGRLDTFVEHRRASVGSMLEALGGSDALRFPALDADDVHSFWRVAFVASEALDLDVLVGRLREQSIPAQARYIGRPAFLLQAMVERGLRHELDDFPGARDGLARALVLPWNEAISVELAAEIGRRLVAAIAEQGLR